MASLGTLQCSLGLGTRCRLARADFSGHSVTVHNIRDCHWRTETDFTLAYYDKTFNLDHAPVGRFYRRPVQRNAQRGAYDAELRIRRRGAGGRIGGETPATAGRRDYSSIKGFLRQYELMYVVASERDVIQRRVNCDLTDVFLYRSTASTQNRPENSSPP